ncbi:MAG: hypothetical protein KME29_04645 [Calothrix sp. FI2-JRJ7]|jgi:hypothetical protein|nr:hypothetical protein [Calothrix sp. FI2-JRJ7]
METLTLDLKSLVRRLLNKQPTLAAWVDVCDIYIDKFENHFSTCLIIDCKFEALANFIRANLRAFLEPIANTSPIPVRIIYQDTVLAAYLPLLELSPNDTTMGLTMVTTTLAPQQTETQPSIALNQIPSSIRDLIHEQVASLKLPVHLTKDGYSIPQTSFDIAWQHVGNAVWQQEFGKEAPTNGAAPSSATKPAKPAANNNNEKRASSQKTEVPRILLMREKLKPEEDIILGRNGIKATLDKFLAKVSFKHFTREQVLEGIANGSDHGNQLLQKLHEAYAKKDGIYKVRPQEWEKTKNKIVDEAKKLLAPPSPETSTEQSEAKQEAETTAQ